jgi:hypothetical protein
VSHTLLDAVMLALTRLGVGNLPDHDAPQPYPQHLRS